MTIEELNGWLMANYNLIEKRDGYNAYSRGHRTIQVWDDGNVVVETTLNNEITEHMTNIKMFGKHLNHVYYSVLSFKGCDIYYL